MNLPIDLSPLTPGLSDVPGAPLADATLAVGEWTIAPLPLGQPDLPREQAEADDPFDDFEEDDFDDEFDDDFEEDWEDDLTQDDEFPDTFGGQEEEADDEDQESTPDSPFQEDPDFDE